jgi:hypothetical protein
LNGLQEVIVDCLGRIENELRARSTDHLSGRIHPFPGISKSESGWVLDGPIDDGIVYEMAFDGNDSDAEILEKATGLAFLGDCSEPYDEARPCAVTGRMTTRRQHLARMY